MALWRVGGRKDYFDSFLFCFVYQWRHDLGIAWCDDHRYHFAFEKFGDFFFFVFTQAWSRFMNQVDAQAADSGSFVFDADAHLIVEEMDFFGDADAYAKVGSPDRQCSGGRVRGVGELLGNGQNFFSCGLADSGTVVEGAVHCADRDSGQFGNFVDSCAFHQVRPCGTRSLYELPRT